MLTFFFSTVWIPVPISGKIAGFNSASFDKIKRGDWILFDDLTNLFEKEESHF